MSTTTTSIRRLEANRRNAQLSTGPRTAEGKARVAQNRTSHGLTSQCHNILPGEDAEAFDRLLSTLMEQHAPATETEAHQVELLAHNQWKLRRAARLENEAFKDSLSPETGRFALTDGVMRASRYMASIRRSYTLALAELRRLQSAREKNLQAELGQALDRHLLAAMLPDDSNPIDAKRRSSQSAQSPDRTDTVDQPPPSGPRTCGIIFDTRETSNNESHDYIHSSGAFLHGRPDGASLDR